MEQQRIIHEVSTVNFAALFSVFLDRHCAITLKANYSSFLWCF